MVFLQKKKKPKKRKKRLRLFFSSTKNFASFCGQLKFKKKLLFFVVFWSFVVLLFFVSFFFFVWQNTGDTHISVEKSSFSRYSPLSDLKVLL